MKEQILNEHKSAQKTIGRLASKSLMDLVREVLLKLGKEDESAEDILFTAEGAKAKKDITDIIVKLLGCDDCNKNDFKIDPKKNEALSKNKSNAYKIEYFLNTAGAERRPRELRDIKHDYQTIKIKASSDLKALEQAFLIQTEEDYYDGIFEDYGVEDTVEGLKDYFDSIDVSEGSPIICRVLRGSTVIYDSGITKDQLLGELDESTEKGEKCVLCGKEIKGHGNNPAPVKDSGRCCDDCNKKVVIPARMKAIKNEEFKESDGAVEAKEEPVVLPELDESCDCKDESSKFNRDSFKFDDDFYGECAHKDCDEDEDEEIEMIFDDDPTISY